MQAIIQLKNRLPANIRHFLLKAVCLFVGWQLLYRLVLAPAHIPDRQLTMLIAAGTARVLSIFYNDVDTAWTGYKMLVLVGRAKVLGIAPACNGLELIVLYISVLLCLPARKRKVLLYTLTGTAAICAINIIRCSALVYLHMYDMQAFHIAHKFIFTLIVYFVIFYGWVLYLKDKRQQPITK